MRRFTRIYLLVIFALAGIAAFTACSKDDDDEPFTIKSIEGEFVGSATGTMVFISQSGEETSQDVTPQGNEAATVTVNDDGTIIIKEPTFFVGKGAYPGAIVRDIPAVLANNAITFSLKDYGSMNGVYTVAGDISGEYKDSKLVLDYTFKHAGQMVGTIHFEGTKK
ncbi:MAG: hypothetical protein IKW77_05875 [Salinivirgaceae bacterium]|nr:hypothetical protein [Salinivirgaceae bacterium]